MSNRNNSSSRSRVVSVVNSREDYSTMRSKIVSFCNEIESCFSSFHYLNDYSSIIQQRLNSIPSSFNPPHISIQKIKTSSLLTEEMDHKIKGILVFEEIESKEEELLTKKNKLSMLERENQSLLLVQSSHIKGLKDYRTRLKAQNNQMVPYREDQQSFRQKIRFKKRLHKATETIIKSQVSQISLLKQKCNIIKDNIAYKRKNEIMALSIESIHNNEEKNKSLDSRIQILKEIFANQEEISASESKDYCHLIRDQHERIGQINEDINALVRQVNELNREKKVKELNEREIRRKESLRKRIKCFKLNKKYSMNTIYENNAKSLRNERMPNNRIKHNGNQNIFVFRKFLNVKALSQRNTLTKQPVKIQKSLIIDYHHTNNNPNRSGDMLSQIESLSKILFILYIYFIGNEIQKAIKM